MTTPATVSFQGLSLSGSEALPAGQRDGTKELWHKLCLFCTTLGQVKPKLSTTARDATVGHRLSKRLWPAVEHMAVRFMIDTCVDLVPASKNWSTTPRSLLEWRTAH